MNVCIYGLPGYCTLTFHSSVRGNLFMQFVFVLILLLVVLSSSVEGSSTKSKGKMTKKDDLFESDNSKPVESGHHQVLISYCAQ